MDGIVDYRKFLYFFSSSFSSS